MLGLFENLCVSHGLQQTSTRAPRTGPHSTSGSARPRRRAKCDGTLPFAEVRIDAETGAARKARIFVSGMELIASLYGEIVDDPTEADIAIMR